MGGRGRGNRSRTQRKHFRDGRENVWKRHKSDSASSDPNSNRNSDNKTHWQPFSTQNPGFDEYYKEQGIVTPEEWDTFVEVLRTPLPVALGVFVIVVTSCYSSKKMWMKNLDADFSNTTDGDEVEAIRPLPWYPDNLAWHSNFSRMQLRKNQTLERNPGKGNGLHSLQIQIALRELGFLAFGDNQGFQGFDFEKSCHGACSVTAENSGMEPDSIDAAVEKNYELASEADLVVNEPDEAAMEPDLSNISDQNDSEEA
ncbi:hypothetical protein D5086_010200 [Populus alba]|uniref:Uncharacterized protein n=1 Tax=Populus alba TaxID=43335 RepID=A0ACC4C9D8_POPAL